MKIDFVKKSNDDIKDFDFETAKPDELVEYFEKHNPKLLHYI
jgi:hypothetical protein